MDRGRPRVSHQDDIQEIETVTSTVSEYALSDDGIDEADFALSMPSAWPGGSSRCSATTRKIRCRAQLDGQSVDNWAQGRGVSRATAYRMLARIKSLCRVEFDQRTDRTRLEVLDVLRGQL